MDKYSYVTKDYSTYTNVPTHEGGYDYGPKQAANYYVVETTTVERRHGPITRYNNVGSAPPQIELFKEYVPKYALKDHYEDYDPNYGSDHEDLSPPGYHKRENLMEKFLSKVQLGASRPTQTSMSRSMPRSYFSEENHKIKPQNLPNKVRPNSPNHHYPSGEGPTIKTHNLSGQDKYPTHTYPSEEGHKVKAQNFLGPNNYQLISPTHSDPSEEGHKIRTENLSGPNKYRPTSPTHRYPLEEDHNNNFQSQNVLGPNKYQHISSTHSYPLQEGHNTTTQNSSGSNKYQPIIPTQSYPPEEGHNVKTQNMARSNRYQPTSPTHSYPLKGHNIKTQNSSGSNKYRPTSPIRSYPPEEGYKIQTQNMPDLNKYRPTSPTHSYPTEEGHNIKTQNMYGPNKYRPTSPTHNYPSEEGQKIKIQNFPDTNKHQPTSLKPTYPSKEGDLIKTSLGPNKHHHSSPVSEGSRYVRSGNFMVPNIHWLSAGPPMTHHPLTTSTNNINEALSFITESVNYSSRSGPTQTGGARNSGFHAQPIEPVRRYARPGFMGTTTQTSFESNTIDSREAMEKYNGVLVP
ncbi:unnamed protein product [Lactuca saligna]|uniref:Uncharacterized protein n=1 Tax=Lactuca saligna TaxID=75948 RepID=A0AA35Y9M7_LACSI|nr:unnamed protein product [Lactuca saligna]